MIRIYKINISLFTHEIVLPVACLLGEQNLNNVVLDFFFLINSFQFKISCISRDEILQGISVEKKCY